VIVELVARDDRGASVGQRPLQMLRGTASGDHNHRSLAGGPRTAQPRDRVPESV
jgi:hypothetical protein